ncbi:MAG: PD-(D/E)XK nuclease family protein [Eubacterium sp.]|nr:PD-(D/E)XK nuclease family protein [Eubacterium sp.]
MALQLVLGSSGSGKTRCLYETLIKMADENPTGKYIVIVPDQFTMETQKELVNLHPRNGIGNIDILSFGRLAYRLFEEAGKGIGNVLDDTAKNLIIRRVVSENEEDLKIFNGSMLKKIGCVDEIKSFISELMTYGVTLDDLAKMSDESRSENLKLKLDDVYLIYEKFLDKIGDENMVQEGILAEAGILAEESSLLDKACVVLDGFTGFTPIQLKFLEVIMNRASDIYLAATVDENTDINTVPPMHELFYMSVKMIHELKEMAQRCLVAVKEPIYMKENHRFKGSPALLHLEKNVFRDRTGSYLLEENKEEISISSLSSPKDEMVYAARKIRELLKEGYEPGDFAIVTGDAVGYENYARTVFNEYGIPVFLDQTHNLVFHPFVDALRAIMQMAEEDYSYKSVFAYLRSGFSALETDETDKLENFVLSYGIRGFRSWNRKWKRKDIEETDLEIINEIRETFVSETGEICEILRDKSKTVREKTRAFYDFILSLKMGETLRQKEEEFEERGDVVRKIEYAQVYRIVLQIFEKFDLLLGDEIIPADEYRKLMEAGFTSGSLGVLPQRKDAVCVGDIERTRLNNIKVLFFAGVNEGIIPSMQAEGGILSEQERRYLIDGGASLAYGARENAMLKNFYLYLNLTKPKERLYITFSRANSEGDGIRKSYIIDVIKKLYENLEIKEYPSYDDEEFSSESLYLPKGTLKAMANTVRKSVYEESSITEDFKAGYLWYSKNYKNGIDKVIDSAFLSNEKIMLKTADELYGKKIKASISRLEKYASCAYSYFLNYGLYLKERKSYSFESFDMGNIYHDAANILATELEHRNLSFKTIDDNELEKLVDVSIDGALNKYEDSALFSTKRLSYMAKRMRRVFAKTAKNISSQMRAGGYEVILHESGFSLDYDIGEGRKMNLVGKIDRVDAAKSDDKTLVRIVDYKSYGKELLLNELYEGLSLQLALYMNAAMAEIKKKLKTNEVYPGGVLYYGIRDPIVNASFDEDDNEIFEKVRKELRMIGYVNSEEDILKEMDYYVEGASFVANYSINKNGSVSSKSKTLSSEEFDAVLCFADEKAESLSKDIAKGKIDKNPYQLGDKTGCKYCPYSGICGFDRYIPGYSYRKIQKRDEHVVIEEIMRRKEQD